MLGGAIDLEILGMALDCPQDLQVPGLHHAHASPFADGFSKHLGETKERVDMGRHRFMRSTLEHDGLDALNVLGFEEALIMFWDVGMSSGQWPADVGNGLSFFDASIIYY